MIDPPVTQSDTIGALPDNAGSKVNGSLGGTPFIASRGSTIVSTGTPPTLTMVGSTTERTITISLANMTAAGTYTLSATAPIRSIQLSGVAGNPIATWNSQSAGGGGTVTISSFTATRVVGSYSATLAAVASGATGMLAVIGTFDMGR